jgi:hypothetical protein
MTVYTPLNCGDPLSFYDTDYKNIFCTLLFVSLFINILFILSITLGLNVWQNSLLFHCCWIFLFCFVETVSHYAVKTGIRLKIGLL